MDHSGLDDAFEQVIGRIARLSWPALAPDVQAAALALVQDALAVAAVGTIAPGIPESMRSLPVVRDGVAVPWTSLELTPVDAAMALSFCIHAWEYDDTHDQGLVHTSSVAVAAAYGAVMMSGASGERFLSGVVAGVEVLAKLALAVGAQRGIIRTGGLGAFAAAAAAAVTLGLERAEIRRALDVAASSAMTAGSRQALEDDGVAKRLQPGFAVRAGVTAALLARSGVTGASGWLSGEFGLHTVISDTDGAAETFSDPAWEVARLSLKPYPSCRFTHASILAAGELRGLTLTADDRVRVHVPHGGGHARVARPWARRGHQVSDRQFSVPWLVSAVLQGESIDVSLLERDIEADHAIEILAGRVQVVQDQVPDDSGLAPVLLAVSRPDGTEERIIVESLGEAVGLREDLLAEKTASCLASAGWPASAALHLTEVVTALPAAERGQLFASAPWVSMNTQGDLDDDR